MQKSFSLAFALFLIPLALGGRDEVIRQAVDDIDRDGDGLITESELHSEFVLLVDTNQDWIITKEEFVNMETGWPSFYGDSQETAEQFFDNLDVVCFRRIRSRPLSGCGYLGPMDLIQHYRNMEDHDDQVVTKEQLFNWMNAVYPLGHMA